MAALKNKIGRLISVFVLVAICSCKEAKEPEAFDKESVAFEIEQMLIDYHSAMNKGGLMAEFDYLDDSPDFFWVPPGYETALTYDSVRTILTSNSKSLRSVKFHWDTLQVFPLSTTVGSYTGIVKGQMVDTSGAETNVSIIESGTLIKRTDGWKLLNGQSAVLNSKIDSVIK